MQALPGPRRTVLRGTGLGPVSTVANSTTLPENWTAGAQPVSDCRATMAGDQQRIPPTKPRHRGPFLPTRAPLQGRPPARRATFSPPKIERSPASTSGGARHLFHDKRLEPAGGPAAPEHAAGVSGAGRGADHWGRTAGRNLSTLLTAAFRQPSGRDWGRPGPGGDGSGWPGGWPRHNSVDRMGLRAGELVAPTARLAVRRPPGEFGRVSGLATGQPFVASAGQLQPGPGGARIGSGSLLVSHPHTATANGDLEAPPTRCWEVPPWSRRSRQGDGQRSPRTLETRPEIISCRSRSNFTHNTAMSSDGGDDRAGSRRWRGTHQWGAVDPSAPGPRWELRREGGEFTYKHRCSVNQGHGPSSKKEALHRRLGFFDRVLRSFSGPTNTVVCSSICRQGTFRRGGGPKTRRSTRYERASAICRCPLYLGRSPAVGHGRSNAAGRTGRASCPLPARWNGTVLTVIQREPPPVAGRRIRPPNEVAGVARLFATLLRRFVHRSRAGRAAHLRG